MQKMSIDTLISARWVIPVEPHGCVLEQHAIAVKDGRIVAVLPIIEAQERFSATQHIARNQHVLIPGLVNAHTHASMTLLRGLADDLPLMRWLQEHIWPTEKQWLSPDFVRDGAALAVAEMLCSGTTCFNDMYMFPESTAAVAHETGIRARIGLVALEFPTPYAQHFDEYVEKGQSLFAQYQAHPRVRTAWAPHAPYTVSADALSRVQILAESCDIPIHIHVHETEMEVAGFIAQHGCRPLAILAQRGLLTPRLLAVHMTQLTQEEQELLADTGAHVVHCPESNLKLGSGFCPVVELLARGVNVALGTDGAASNNDLDLFGEMRTTALIAKGMAKDPSVLPAADVLRMATLGGARALGWEGLIGSLTVGKAADIVAIDLNTPATQPVYDPLSQLIYAASRSQVTDVWVDGQALLVEGQLTTMDVDAIMERAEGWRARIR